MKSEFLTVSELIKLLESVPQDAVVGLRYDSFCGGTDLDREDGYGIVFHDIDNNRLLFACESLDYFLDNHENIGCECFYNVKVLYP